MFAFNGVLSSIKHATFSLVSEIVHKEITVWSASFNISDMFINIFCVSAFLYFISNEAYYIILMALAG